MPRQAPSLDEEKRSYGALWLVSSLLLFVGALWAIADDNIFRRPWKKWQAEFNRLEIRRLKEAMADEQKRLDADPEYKAAAKALEDAKRSVTTGEGARKIAELQRELTQAQHEDQKKDFDLRFVKSELEELRFKYDDALHTGRPTEALLHEIQEKEQVRVERQKIYSGSQTHIEDLQNQIKTLQGTVKTGEDALAKLTTARDDLQQKLQGASLGYLPGPTASPPSSGFDWQPKIPKIQQLVLEEFERNNFNKPIARVDRCVSCHAGINKAGFEDQPNPWKTHPRRELYLGKHPPEKFGCTPCHGGQGPAVNSVETAHGNFLDKNGHVENVEFAAPAVDRGLAERGKELVGSLGCRACHALAPDEVAGQLGANKDIAPNLSGIAEKTDAVWIYSWIKNPRGYSAIARMPNLRLSDDEARAITAYLVTLGEKKPAPADLAARLADPANVAAGEKLVRKYGCAGCHDIPGMESESRIGVELSSFGSKTREELFFGDRTDVPETWDDWTYNKLLTPRTYATKWIEQVMPQFDLADGDIKALRAFLASRTDAKVPVRYAYHAPGEERIIAGRRLVARYNCTGCHVIENTGGDIRRLYVDNPTLAPPILLGEGEKVQADWLFNFVKAPQPIRPWLSLRIPTFGLADEEANTVVGYFETFAKVQVPFVHIEKAAFSPESVAAGKLLTGKDYFDCFSCHQRGAQKPQGPPEGWAPDLALAHLRLNPEWIIKWLHDPQKVMPGTKMPSFFPGGPPDVLGGDDEVQIRALRDYVVSLGLPDVAPSPQQAAGVTSAGPGASQ